jgi:hypothetical protein
VDGLFVIQEMKTLILTVLAMIPLCVGTALGNLLPGDAATAWGIVAQHEFGVIGKLEEQSILVVFADGKPVQQGGAKIEKSDNLPVDGIALMSGRIEIEKVIYDRRSVLNGKTHVWVTWTEHVYLREGHGGGSMCPHVSGDTKAGKRSLILTTRGTGGYEIARDMDLKYLEWIQEGKKAAEEAARLEGEKNNPFAEDSDPYRQQKTQEDNKAEMATPSKPSD